MFIHKLIPISKMWEQYNNCTLSPLTRVSVPIQSNSPTDCALVDFEYLTFVIDIRNNKYKNTYVDFFYHPANNLQKTKTTDLLLPGTNMEQITGGTGKNKYPSMVRKIYFKKRQSKHYVVDEKHTFEGLSKHLLGKIDFENYYNDNVESEINNNIEDIEETIRNHILQSFSGGRISGGKIPYIITFAIDGKFPAQNPNTLSFLTDRVFGTPSDILCQYCGKEKATKYQKYNPNFGRWKFITADDKSFSSYQNNQLIHLCIECRSHVIQSSDIVDFLFTFLSYDDEQEIILLPQFTTPHADNYFFSKYQSFLSHVHTSSLQRLVTLDKLLHYMDQNQALDNAIFHKYSIKRTNAELKIKSEDGGIVGQVIRQHYHSKKALKSIFKHLNVQFDSKYWYVALTTKHGPQRYYKWLGFMSNNQPYILNEAEILSCLEDIGESSSSEWFKKVSSRIRKLWLMQLYQKVFNNYSKGGRKMSSLEKPPVLPANPTDKEKDQYVKDMTNYIEGHLSNVGEDTATTKKKKAFIVLGMKAKQAVDAEWKKNTSNTQKAIKRFRMTHHDALNLVSVVEDTLTFRPHSKLTRSILNNVWNPLSIYILDEQEKLNPTEMNSCIAMGFALYDLCFPYAAKKGEDLENDSEIENDQNLIEEDE